MKSVIVGTAGHIDHGKTALVKALTGIDADRLEEEKRRGITIDLGFAHMELTSANGEPLHLGFVDAPRHGRFVRNMPAGVGRTEPVMTGTLISGTIRREEELEVFPTGRRARVRGVQVHGHAADAAIAGQRTALNVAGASTEDLARGMTLAPRGSFSTTRRVDVRLSL